MLSADPPDTPEALLDAAVRANVLHAVADLRRGSQVVEELIEHQGLVILGAVYSLDTGVVEFLEDV